MSDAQMLEYFANNDVAVSAPIPRGDLQSASGLLALLSLPGIGNAKAIKFATVYGSLGKLQESASNSPELLGDEVSKAIQELQIDSAVSTHQVLSCFDPDYPAGFNNLANKPAVIWVEGTIPLGLSLAVVGTRNPSARASQITRACAEMAVECGLVVVSGLAKGIDSIAHETTVQRHAKTLAVLGTSIEDALTGTSRELANLILENGGALVSAVQDGDKPTNQSFIGRNALIVALSDQVLVAECGLVSGTMHTAKYAIEQGKPLLVIKDKQITAEANSALLDSRTFQPELFGESRLVRVAFTNNPGLRAIPISTPDDLREQLR